MQNYDYTYNVVQTKSGQVGYVVIGNDSLPPLILVVGYSGNLLHWNKEFVLALAEHYTVYLPDNRLVGQSESNNEESIAGMAQDIADFIDVLGLQQVSVVGWSMGGIITQNLAINHADKIKQIGLLGSLPDYSFTHGSLHTLVSNLLEEPSKANRDKLMHLFYSEELSIEFRKYLARNILRIESYVYPFHHDAQKFQDKAVTEYQIDFDLLEQIRHPVIIITAKNDLVNKPEASHLLHNLIPQSQLISFATGGHFFLNVHPLQTAKHIIDYFKVNEE